MNLPGYTTLQFNESFTLAIWCRPTALSGTHSLFDKYSRYTPLRFHLYIDNADSDKFKFDLNL